MKRYNLALLPLSIGPQVLQLARPFSKLSDGYLLGPGSLPHVTVCQFYAEEDKVAAIWEKARQAFREKVLPLEFHEANSLALQGRLWVQLIPKPNEHLQHLHQQVAKMVEAPLGLVFEAYSPHMTLANIRSDQREVANSELASLQLSLSDDFVLALGSCDEDGQFTAVLYGPNKSHAYPGE